MKITLALTAAALLAATGCSSGPSLDQQQQAWEQDIHTEACESIQRLEPGSVETRWAFQASAAGENWADDYKAMADAKAAGRQYTCGGPVFQRYYQEWLVEDFPDSPKGQAGETTAPMTP